MSLHRLSTTGVKSGWSNECIGKFLLFRRFFFFLPLIRGFLSPAEDLPSSGVEFWLPMLQTQRCPLVGTTPSSALQLVGDLHSCLQGGA